VLSADRVFSAGSGQAAAPVPVSPSPYAVAAPHAVFVGSRSMLAGHMSPPRERPPLQRTSSPQHAVQQQPPLSQPYASPARSPGKSFLETHARSYAHSQPPQPQPQPQLPQSQPNPLNERAPRAPPVLGQEAEAGVEVEVLAGIVGGKDYSGASTSTSSGRRASKLKLIL